MPGWASPARPAVYKPPAGAQVASPQSPILRRSRSRLSELHHQTRGADKSPLLIARLLLLSTNGLLLLTRLSPFARPATEATEDRAADALRVRPINKARRGSGLV